MASRISIPCQSCGHPTMVDLDRPYAEQPCAHCGEVAATGRSGREEGKRRRVKRVAGEHGREKGWQDTTERARRGRRWWPSWLKVTISLAALLALAGLVTLMITRHYSTADGVGAPRLNDPDMPADVRLKEDFQAQAKEVAQQVLSADTLDRLLPLLSYPGTPEREVRAHFGPGTPGGELPIGRRLLDEVEIPPGEFDRPVVQFVFEDSRGRGRLMAVEQGPDGLKADWASMEAVGGMTLAEFSERRPALPVMLRLRGKVGHYHNYAFSDEKRWLCLKLSHLDRDEFLYAYLERSHPLADEILATFADTDQPGRTLDRPITGWFRCPAGTGDEVLAEIISVAGLTWYFPNGIPDRDAAVSAFPEP